MVGDKDGGDATEGVVSDAGVHVPQGPAACFLHARETIGARRGATRTLGRVAQRRRCLTMVATV